VAKSRFPELYSSWHTSTSGPRRVKKEEISNEKPVHFMLVLKKIRSDLFLKFANRSMTIMEHAVVQFVDMRGVRYPLGAL